MTLHTVTDWLGLVPIFVCMLFGVIGFVQLINRKSLLKVDFDIIILGRYYVIKLISLSFNILTVVFLALTRETYAIVIAFLMMIMKGAIILKYEKSERRI